MSDTIIEGTDSVSSILSKMSKGNLGATKVLNDIIKNPNIDPDNVMGGLGAILSLDTHGIYGTDIYVLYNDICDRKLPKMLAVVRACQLGFLRTSVLKDACGRQDRSGKHLIPVEELYNKVKKRLPRFDCITA